MPPLMLRKVNSLDSLSSEISSPESIKKKLKSPRELPPLSIPPRRRTSSSDSSGGPSPLQRSRSNSSDVAAASSISPPNRRRTKSFESSPETPRSKAPAEKSDLDMKLQQAILQYGSTDARVGDLWNAMGNSYFRAGDLKGAIRAYKSAALCGKGSHIATAYLNLGTTYWNTLQVKKGIECLQKALKGFQVELALEGKSTMDSLEVANCYHQLGLAYSLEQCYDRAAVSMETALDIRVRILGTYHLTTARTLDAAGRVQLMRGDTGRALSYHEKSLAILSQLGYSPVSTLENLAGVYTALGDLMAVVHMYVQIVHWLKANWIAQPSPGLLRSSLLKLAQSYEHVGELRYAEDCRNEAELLG